MNIFIFSTNPVEAARFYPDKIVNKISLEICQMIGINYGEDYLDWGVIPKKNGEPYKSKNHAHRNHPCTRFLRENEVNLAWGITHGLALALEHGYRKGKVPATYKTLLHSKKIFEQKTGMNLCLWEKIQDSDFVRAMKHCPEIMDDESISNVEAYRRYVLTKPYKDIYSRREKPDFI